MREPMSEISNTIKHRYFNQTRITRTRKWGYLISEDHRNKDNIRIFVKN